MNNFELHEEAELLADTKSSYELARQLVKVSHELNNIKNKPLKDTQKLQMQCLNKFLDDLGFYKDILASHDTYINECNNNTEEEIKITFNNAVKLYNLTQPYLLAGVKGKVIINGSSVQELKNMITKYKISVFALEEAMNNKAIKRIYLQHKKKTNKVICQKHLVEF
jgi:hypothetical protein